MLEVRVLPPVWSDGDDQVRAIAGCESGLGAGGDPLTAEPGSRHPKAPSVHRHGP